MGDVVFGFEAKEIRPFEKPVLIIHGIEDEAVDIRYSELAEREYKNCKLIRVHGDHGLFRFGFSEAKRATQRELRRWDVEKILEDY